MMQRTARTSAGFGVVVCASTLALFVVHGRAQSKITPAPEPASLRFVAFGAGLPTSGQWREGFRVADLNGDGFLDIVHGSQRKQPGQPPAIFLGDGKGSWTRWKEARFPSLAYDYGDVEVADFNGDGYPDLALAVHYHGLLVLTGDGLGNFSQASADAAGLEFDAKGAAQFSSRAIRVTDWNGDGRPDLIAAWEGPRPGAPSTGPNRHGLAVYLNQGPKGWQRSDPLLSPGVFSDSLTLGDFDGDGHTDVAVGSSVLSRKDLVNLWRASGATPAAPLAIPGVYHYVQAVGAGDFDGDGKDDLAAGYLSLENEVWYTALDVFYSRPGGTWERRTLSKEPTRNVAVALASGHLRATGTRDLVALTMQGETIVYLADGHGGFARNTAIPVYPGRCRGAHVELADLDGDGIDEIVTAFADEPDGETCPTGGGITAWKAVPTK